MLSNSSISDLAARVRNRLWPIHFIDIDRSPQRALMTDADFRADVARLKAHAAADFSAEVAAGRHHPNFADSQTLTWFQRLRIPGTAACTTSDRSQPVSDPGWLNRLGTALTADEGGVLRPMPKWSYIERILPDLRGKTVMEIGSNNGFFCFEFLDKGAASVTGIEVGVQYINAARWMAKLRDAQNLSFLQTDVMLDLTIPRHDVVFMSEVYTHFIDPLLGLLRAVNLARETLIIDGPMLRDKRARMHLNIVADRQTRRPNYLAWTMTDGMMLHYLALCGITPDKVVRYISPLRNHIVFVVDTRDVEADRQRNEFAPTDTPFLHEKFIVPA